MQFVGDEKPRVAKGCEPARLAEQEREALRGRHEDVRRPAFLLRALLRRRVARARAHAQPIPAKLIERLLKILAQIVRERAQRRNVHGHDSDG